MKLFLHWLLWDLRRFRSLLLLWTLLVLGYAACLGWLQYHILDADPGYLKFTGPLAGGLALVGFLMVLWIFTADPAAGTGSFWKLRPPTGYAVAGSKLVIVFPFFVLLPALVLSAAGFAAAPAGLGWELASSAFWKLFPVFLPVLAFLLLGTAASGSPLQAGMRMGASLILVLGLVISVNVAVAYQLLFTGLSPESPAVTPWLWGLAGAAVFLLARKSRNPPRAFIPLTVLAPFLLLVGQSLLVRVVGRTSLEKSVAPLEARAAGISAGPIPIRNNPGGARGRLRFDSGSRENNVQVSYTIPSRSGRAGTSGFECGHPGFT